MPKSVQELLLHLFRYGPNTTGIFRKSANARIAKEIKLELDEGKRGLFISLDCWLFHVGSCGNSDTALLFIYRLAEIVILCFLC